MKNACGGTLMVVLLVTAPALADERRQEIERAASETIDACSQDLRQFCSEVTPGEGKVLACLWAYEDQVSPPCAMALKTWRRPTVEQTFQTTKSYPTLEQRELGNPNLDESGEPVVWKRRLPFMAQKVVDLGFELPNPYGVALIPARIRQDLVLQNLSIGINGPPDTPIDFVDFGTPNVTNSTLQLKLDAWVFPFLNVFTTVGVLDGKAEVPIKIEGADLFPDFCAIFPSNAQCVRTYSAVAEPGYHGENVSLGINLAMGWDRFFVTLPITYAWSDVNIIDTTVEALNITPRIGMTGDAGRWGTIAVFVGATYLEAEVDLTGSISFDTPGGPEGDTTTISFLINQQNKDRWNYLIGFNWELNRNWAITAEGGFGGSRENFIGGITYRW
jgi:hypothetical protein